MSRESDRQAEIVSAIVNMIRHEEEQTLPARRRWKEAYDLFVFGTQFPDKDRWQSKLSIPIYENRVRTSAAAAKFNLVHNPDWWDLEPRNQENQQAVQLSVPLKKVMGYALETSNFQRHASSFIINAHTTMGSMLVSHKIRLVQNPKWVLEKTRKEREKEEAGLASLVENPQTGNLDQDQLVSSIENALRDATESPEEQPETKQFIRVSVPEYQVIDPRDVGYDSNVQHMPDTPFVSYRTEMKMWKVKELAKRGFFIKKNIKDLKPRQSVRRRTPLRREAGTAFGNSNRANRGGDVVDLLVYFGPLIVDDKVKKHNYFCIIANDSELIKEGDYPFWEPTGHMTPMVMTAVKEIPGRSTGAGIGDQAVRLQKYYDSNWNLINDQMRFGVLGLNVAKFSSFVDKGQLERGIKPGDFIEVRDNPKDAFTRIDLTTNVENQVKPVQLAIERGINDSVGIEDTFSGAPQTRSRTTASEVNARVQGSERTVNSISVDLEINFLIPALEKTFARVLQFMIPEVETNPELSALLTDEEKQLLLSLSEQDRFEILNTFFRFKTSGFSENTNKNEKLQRLNEAMTIIQQGGPISQLMPIEKIAQQWIKALELDDMDVAINVGTEISLINSENQLLQAGRDVQPNQTDNDEFHLQNHSQVLNPTPQMQQHMQLHQQQIQFKQQQQQLAAQGQQPQQAPQAGPPGAPDLSQLFQQ